MKNKIIFFCLVFFVTIIFIPNSYGQYNRDDPSLPHISLQVVHRDLNGNLVNYVEPTALYISNVYWTHEYLDQINNKTTVTIDGKQYEQIEFERKYSFDAQKQITTFGFWAHDGYVLLFRSDGFISSPGDTISASWKIIRTLR